MRFSSAWWAAFRRVALDWFAPASNVAANIIIAFAYLSAVAIVVLGVLGLIR